MAVNLARKYASKVDERFAAVSRAGLALNHDYDFQGVQTVVVYSIPTVALTNYSRTAAANRYGTPSELQDTIQELTVTRDRAFNFIIDKGNKTQQGMAKDAGRALSREIREKVVPEFDAYVFYTLAKAAAANGATATTAATKNNAYSLFLAGQEALGNAAVPDSGRVCFCSYAFANLLKQDPAFMIQSERSKSAVDRGVIGEVDGVKVVQVPSSRLPSEAAFLLTHPVAACGPKQLTSYKIHNDPPGINGWLVEGRILYDCFVLNSKKNAVWYHGAAPAESFTPPA